MVSPLRDAWRLTHRSYSEIPVTVKLPVPPQQSWGVSHICLAGLIRKYKGRFILSRDCRRLLAGIGLPAVYPRLFRVYAEQFNWAYRDGYPELRFIQSAFLFTLYLLMRYGDISRSQVFYEDAFLRAFPMLLDEVPPSQAFSPD
jgi:hypothetical protein